MSLGGYVRFGLVDLLWQVWFGRFGLVGLAWWAGGLKMQNIG